MTLPKGRVQEGPKKGSIHVGTTDHASNKKIDKECGMANDCIEHQRQHHQDATARDIEEIPLFAVQPEPMLSTISWGFSAQRCCRCIHAEHLLGTRLGWLLPALYTQEQVSRGKLGYKFCKFPLKVQALSHVWSSVRREPWQGFFQKS